MGKEVASAYVTIGAKTDGLKQGLNEAKGGLGKLSDNFKQLTGFSLGSASAIGLVGKSLQASYQYLKQSVEETNAYNAAMAENARIFGMTAEEYSRFTQVADDAFISTEKLNAMLMAAARQGTDVSIAGISALADQYNALSTDQEKAEFTAKNFGRTGLEVYKVLELGSEGIKKKMAAISADLVVTQRAANNTKLFRQAVDALNDSMQGIKYTVGNELTPTVADFALVLADLVERTKETNFGFDDFLIILQALNPLLVPIIAQLGGMVKMTRDYADDLRKSEGQRKNFVKHFGDELPAAINLTVEEIAKAEDKLAKSFMSIAEQSSQAEEDYLSNVKDNNTEMLGLYEERARLRSLGYSNESQAIKDIDKALDDNAQKAEDNAIAHEKATNRIILSYAEQLLAADGLTQAEVDFLLRKGEEWGIYAQGTADKAAIVIAEAGKIADSINAIPTLHEIEIRTRFTEVGHPSGLSGGGTGAGVTTDQTSASGADFIVPPGYPSDSYRMGVQSGEHVKVEPASKVMENSRQQGIDYDRMASSIVYALKRAGAYS